MGRSMGMTETHKPRMETDPGLAPLVGGLGGGVWAGGMWSGQGDMWEDNHSRVLAPKGGLIREGQSSFWPGFQQSLA